MCRILDQFPGKLCHLNIYEFYSMHKDQSVIYFKIALPKQLENTENFFLFLKKSNFLGKLILPKYR